MAKTPTPPPAPEGERGDESRKTGTVRLTNRSIQTITKLAAMRGLTPAELFETPVVDDFFTHELLHELQREQDRLKGQKRK